MDLSLEYDLTQASLFPAKPQGPCHRMLGRLLAIVNAGAAGLALASVRQEAYQLKSTILERYGEKDGVDWQLIEKACWGCEACDPDGYWSRRDAACDGKGVYSKRWIPLERYRLGAHVFHKPGLAVYHDPGKPIKFTNRIKHAEPNEEKARAAFLQLCLMFDRDLFRQLAAVLFSIAKPDRWCN